MNSRSPRRTILSTANFYIGARGVYFLVVVTLVGLAGLTNKALASSADSAVAPYYRRLASEGKRNAVLNNMRIGVIDLEAGDLVSSANALDAAIHDIDSVFANDENARKARSLWYEEGRKNFKGEPYERVMAYYYRGLVDMFNGDYENARADYKGGGLQDAFAEEEQNRCDFALMIFLQGWTNNVMGNGVAAAELFEEVKKLRPDFNPPGTENNLLLIVETGTSPRKLSDGPGHGELVFRPGKSVKEYRVKAAVEGKEISLFPMEEIYWQAATRGGRPIDSILKGKVVFRSSAEGFGSKLSDASQTILSHPVAYQNTTVNEVGAALGLVGAISLAVAVSATPQADERYWDNLPDLVHVQTLKVLAGTPSVEVSVYDKNGAELGEYRKVVPVRWDDKGHGIAWIRTRSALVPLQ